ncbi:MAG: aminopeptidase P family protein [Saprospiraceae bacterium]|nr:aminopeptidase P family protein [Saprospiraceae bacterium]
MFDSATYSRRREILQGKVGSGIILLLGNEETSINFPHNFYPFRQDSSFLYFTGLDRPGLALLIDADSGNVTLYGDDPGLDHVVWMGPQPSLGELSDRTGIEEVANSDKLVDDLAEAGSQGRDIHFLPPYRDKTRLKLSQWLGYEPDEVEAHASETLIRAIVDQRSQKSEEEIAELEEAVRITGAMHLAVMRAARTGMLEAELAGIVEGIGRSLGSGLSYPPIITINGQILHNQYYGNRLEEGQLLLGDFGAENPRHYAGDITRTFPVSASFTPQQAEVYQIVLDALEAGKEALKPGLPYRDVHLLACTRIAQGLTDMGLMKGSPEEAVRAGAHALFFPHGLGHMMGLDVHDMEDLGEDYVGYGEDFDRSDQFGLKSLRLARKLEENFVLTVEPGIYFIPPLIEKWKADGKHTDFINYEKLQPFLTFGGIRIEDDVVVTKEGYRLLGESVPRTVSEIEEIRASALS